MEFLLLIYHDKIIDLGPFDFAGTLIGVEINSIVVMTGRSFEPRHRLLQHTPALTFSLLTRNMGRGRMISPHIKEIMANTFFI